MMPVCQEVEVMRNASCNIFREQEKYNLLTRFLFYSFVNVDLIGHRAQLNQKKVFKG